MTKSYMSRHLCDESFAVHALLSFLDWGDDRAARVEAQAARLIEDVRASKAAVGEIENFLQHYPLTSPEGLSLMTLAEALLRIPDSGTADALIAEKMAASDWKKARGGGVLFRAAEFGLSLARRTLDSVVGGVSRPIVRKATAETVRALGKQFVVGQTLPAALAVADGLERMGYRLSYDMLGEGARTRDDANKYFDSYARAIGDLAAYQRRGRVVFDSSGISVKLSALHPRYSWAQAERCVPELCEKLLRLCLAAKDANIPLTVDAEESDRYEVSIDIITAVFERPELAGWEGFGLAIQAYDKRCFDLVDYLCALARKVGRKLQIRLVKGAYWDSEIKKAQMGGFENFPLFTQKYHTDLSYLACAQKLLANRDAVYPMFAGHNAHTIAAVLDLAGEDRQGFRFQRLFGMGSALGDLLVTRYAPVTIYAPVGSYEDLLPYLVRRMLENGANTSFLNKLRDPHIPVPEIVADPVVRSRARKGEANAGIRLPEALYGDMRRNSTGYDLSSSVVRGRLFDEIPKAVDVLIPVNKPVPDVFALAREGFAEWGALLASERAQSLERVAALLEANTGRFMALLHHEGKKTVLDAVSELREAVDFCRYYAAEGRTLFGEAVHLPGPTGERNTLHLSGRGVFVCISPWNFPLAIFVGQIAAALMAGNSVIAKPAGQTPKIALEVLRLMRQAGVPLRALQVVVGDGALGAELVAHKDVAGVAFTGSTEVARSINRALAAKDGPIVPLIAETGGQNALLADSSALPEQVVDDVILSAFGSAGQRCSALRVLYVQEDIADRVLALLRGAMAELTVGAPDDPATDIGPVIDADALHMLRQHQNYLDGFAKKIAETPLPAGLAGTYFPPLAYEIDHISRLPREVFGPILHVIRYKAENRAAILQQINSSGYGLTFGLHSRLEGRFDGIAATVQAGNVYINRSMIGAVVGVQPFGGQGLSGTGPKAGGPYYLHRFALEKTISQNTTATGGNLDLIGLPTD